MRKRVLINSLFLILMILVAGCSKDKEDPVEPAPDNGTHEFDYTTTVTELISRPVSASLGATLEVTDVKSSLNGLVLDIPSGALPSDMTVKIGTVNNPPALPAGEQYIGTSIDLGPDGTVMNKPLGIQIPYTDCALSDAGISDDTALRLYAYDKAARAWEEVSIQSIDRNNNILYAEIYHFSYYAISGFGGTPPPDLGTPQPGDLLYKLSYGGWRPGHVGIYTGERAYSGNGLASDEVILFNKYNVIEALVNGVQYSYYNIPNVTEEFESQLSSFSGSDVFMGSREPASGALSASQRSSIVAYVEGQIGKPYAWVQTVGALFGLLAGSLVKGPNSFNCVGLAEKAYELAGVNDGEGLTSYWQEEVGIGLPAVLTPAEHYNQTKPAGGANALPEILWASLTPNHGYTSTVILAQIAVSHTYGLTHIIGVTYITDSGYTNPAIYINDEGLFGDLQAGDGIYSRQA
jgi:cell wall-associated NlpC family hydrolase